MKLPHFNWPDFNWPSLNWTHLNWTTFDWRKLDWANLGQYQSWLRPVHARPDALRLFDPLVAALAGSLLLSVSALGFSAFGVMLVCAFLAYLVLTRVFGISLDFDPQLFRQYAAQQSPPA